MEEKEKHHRHHHHHKKDKEEKSDKDKEEMLFSKKEGEKVTMDDFQMLEVIGKGSFGKVLLVRMKSTGKIYAMKILSKSTVVQRKQVMHTKAEKNILQQMQHPFIIKLHYAFQVLIFFVFNHIAFFVIKKTYEKKSDLLLS